MHGVLAWALLAVVGPAWSQEEAPEPEAEPAAAPAVAFPVALPPQLSPEDRLSAGIQAYLSGELDAARQVFLLLVADSGLEQSHPTVRREAQVYLGSLDYSLGDRDAARGAFRSILLVDPDHELDPFAHPPELLAFFDAIRVEVQALRPVPAAVVDLRPRLNPLLLMVPGGLQLYNDQRAYGLLVLGGVVVVGSTSIFAGAQLRRMDTKTETARIDVTNDSDKLLAERLKLTANVTGIGGLALWSATFLHGALVSTRTDSTRAVSVVGPNVVVRW